jgi:hypothetical protein
MSDNLDLVRSIYADWERGDYRRADWALSEIEYVQADGPHPGTWIGQTPDGFRDLLSAWTEFQTRPESYRELDEERVFVLTHVWARGKASGVEFPEALGLFGRQQALVLGIAEFDRDLDVFRAGRPDLDDDAGEVLC